MSALAVPADFCGPLFSRESPRFQLPSLPLTHFAMATDRGSLQKDIYLPGTSPQVPCWLEEGSIPFLTAIGLDLETFTFWWK